MEPSTEKLDSIQQRYGFEEREAEAFWHLRTAQRLMLDLAQEDMAAMMDKEDRGELQKPESEVGRLIVDTAVMQDRIGSHFVALERELSQRVLRRNYPEGWGRNRQPDQEEDAPEDH